MGLRRGRADRARRTRKREAARYECTHRRARALDALAELLHEVEVALLVVAHHVTRAEPAALVEELRRGLGVTDIALEEGGALGAQLATLCGLQVLLRDDVHDLQQGDVEAGGPQWHQGVGGGCTGWVPDLELGAGAHPAHGAGLGIAVEEQHAGLGHAVHGLHPHGQGLLRAHVRLGRHGVAVQQHGRQRLEVELRQRGVLGRGAHQGRPRQPVRYGVLLQGGEHAQRLLVVEGDHGVAGPAAAQQREHTRQAAQRPRRHEGDARRVRQRLPELVQQHEGALVGQHSATRFPCAQSLSARGREAPARK